MQTEAIISEFSNSLQKLKEWYFVNKTKKESLENLRNDIVKEIHISQNQYELLSKVRKLVITTSEYARDESKKNIEEIVTNCLQFIFDTDIEFCIEINEIRGKPDAQMYVMNEYNGVVLKTKPESSRGGGIIDIISLALRLAMLECYEEGQKIPIILDEPAKHVSNEYITNVGEFLKQITTLFERQVIIVTHNNYLSEIADKWYKLEMYDGVSRIIIDS